MKGKQRILALMLAVMMLITCCAACGKKSGNSESTGASEGKGTEQVSGSETSSESESSGSSEGTSEEGKKPDTVPALKKGNIFKNPCFEDGDKEWTAGNGSSAISKETADKAIVGDIKTYGKIDREKGSSSQFDCFAQEITSDIAVDVEYEYEFYVMLSDDYKGAPDNQRTVALAPYYTLDGNTEYLGTYSSTAEFTGDVSLTLKPGVWTKFSGTFKLTCGKKPEKVVVRILEQGADWQDAESCTMGDYYVTAAYMRSTEYVDEGTGTSAASQKGYEKDLPNLKDYLASKDGIGEDAIVGCVLNSQTISNKDISALCKKHFNAVTFENETKPDCHFGYAGSCTKLVDYELNGKTVQMPTLNFGSADRMLNVILQWNEANPDSKIRVRGHTLVWHSQTPEWFFHEDFDASKPYVTPEVMDEREEWYIKYVLEHYHGKDSKYKDLFYAWDVVNEAVSDTGGTDNVYRTDKEGTKSSWWAVYQSNKFIINAFKFANKYAPADIDLYYNDYGDASEGRSKKIAKLLQDVKAADGTRLDGMGMQSHYGYNDPLPFQYEKALRLYTGIVDKVMMSEFDYGASSTYQNSPALRKKDSFRQKEFINMGLQYSEYYQVIKKVNAESTGGKLVGITFWGVSDNNSWINEKVDGTWKGCPLLFDENYKAKPAFWAFVDPSKVKTMYD